MSCLDHIPNKHRRVSTVVNRAIIYMQIRGTLANFGKLGKLDGSKVAAIVAEDIDTAVSK